MWTQSRTLPRTTGARRTGWPPAFGPGPPRCVPTTSTSTSISFCTSVCDGGVVLSRLACGDHCIDARLRGVFSAGKLVQSLFAGEGTRLFVARFLINSSGGGLALSVVRRRAAPSKRSATVRRGGSGMFVVCSSRNRRSIPSAGSRCDLRRRAVEAGSSEHEAGLSPRRRAGRNRQSRRVGDLSGLRLRAGPRGDLARV